MKDILVLFAHPKFEQSRANQALVRNVRDKDGVTFHDLYERYPSFDIDIDYEKQLLEKHEVVVWHHPFYWYSCPPLMKQWIDLVLEYGWAYGPNGKALVGKKVLQVVTTGGSEKMYCAEGRNQYSVNQFLRPFEQTARLCGMQYLSPFAVMGTHRLSEDELEKYATQYREILTCLQNDKPIQSLKDCVFQNDLPQLKN